MRHLIQLAIWSCLCGTAFADGACQVAATVPADLKNVGSGSATVHYDGTTKVRGGQSVYVKIKNANVLGVSMSLSVVEDLQPNVQICTYNAILPPQTTGIYSGALFGDPPIPWKVTVSVGSESDAGVLTYEVYSQPPDAASPKAKKKK